MSRIVIATHGHLSDELKASAEIIVGAAENVDCFAMDADMSLDDAKSALSQLIINADKPGRPLVLVDLYGGTPSRVCTELLIDGHEFDLLAGVNLPMVIAAISESGDQRVAAASDAAAEGIVNVNNLIAEMENGT